MDLTPKTRLIQILVGACIAFIALFFPLFTVTFNPPGGSAVVAGNRIPAVISGWQFADSAAYFKLLPTIGMLFSLAGVGFIRLFLSPKSAMQVIRTLDKILNSHVTGSILDYLHAFVHIIIALSWLLVLLLAMLVGSAEMPVSGEAGILPAFQIPPYAPAAAQPVTIEVPYLSATIGIGYFLLLLGIAIGGLAVFKKVVVIIIALIVILPISYYVDHAIFQWLLQFLGI